MGIAFLFVGEVNTFRTKGTLTMGKKKNTNKYEPERWETPISNNHYTRLYDLMLTSEAWKDLSHSARSLYPLLKMQHRGSISGRTIKCPYSYLKEYGMNSTTIRNAIRDLERHGFIKCVSGTLVTKNLHRQPNEYEFVSDWIDWKKGTDKKRELPDKLKELNQKKKKDT